MVAIYPYLFVRILPFWHQCAKFNVSKSKKSCMCSPFLQKCIWLSSHLVPGHGAPVRYSLSSGFQDIRSFIKAYQRLNYLQKCQQEHQNVSSSNPLLLCYTMTHDFKKHKNEVKSHFKRGSFSFGNGLPSRLSTLDGLFIHKNFIPKYLANAHRFCSNFKNIEVAIY